MNPSRPFSERLGIVRRVVQFDEMDDLLRNSIWNFVSGVIEERQGDYGRTAVEEIAASVFRLPFEEVGNPAPHWLLKKFKAVPWPTVYDVLEYTVDHSEAFSYGLLRRARAEELANEMLRREYSGFRFIGGLLSRVMDPAEGAEVETALVTSNRYGLDGVRE
jgi:hypothetical protein